MSDRIDEKDLPRVSPAPTSYVRAVQGGKSVLIPLPEVTNAAALVADAIEGIKDAAQAQAELILGGLGYLPPVAFGSGLDVDSTRFTVTYNGVTYAPVADEVPFTTTGTFNPDQWRVIQGVTAADLSLPSAAGMIGFKQAGSGAVERTVQGKLYDLPVHLLDFVPVAEHAAILNGTSTYDCGPALANAIAAAQSNSLGANVVLLPKGLINTSQTFTITSPVRLVGQGGAPAPGFTTFPTELGTTIKYTGADTNAVLFTFHNVNYGGSGLYHLGLNGNGVAYRGLILDGVLGFGSDDLHVTRFTNVLVGLISTGGTTSWNQFKNLYLEGELDGGASSACLWLSGGDGPGGIGSNACHCTFENLRINHGGVRHAIVLGGCDNITLLQTFIYRAPGGTGYGVKVEHHMQDGHWFPIANTFYHLQAGDGGWFEPAGGNPTYPTACIYGYQTDNGQPLPVTNGRRLPYTTNSGDMVGVRSIGNTSYGHDWAGTVSATSGSTSTVVTFSAPRSSAAYGVILNSPTTIGYAIQDKTASGFTIKWASALPDTYPVDWLIIGG